MPHEPILVTDGYWKKSLAAVRALAEGGFHPIVGEVTRLAPALWSRSAAARFVHPSPTRDIAGFVKTLKREAGRHRAEVLLPMEEETLLVAARARDEGALPLVVPWPSAPEIERLRDKGSLPDIAARCGIPVPGTALASPGDDLDEAARTLRAPFIVKPRIGSGGRGQVRAASRDELARLRPRVPVVVQEALPPGPVVCVSLLLDDQGGVLARFAHRRLRTHPASGGPSTLCESVHAPEAEELALRLLRGVGWSGVAMLEFLEGRLIEVNPRLWGSLALAVRCGVNFPALLARKALGFAIEPVLRYPAGVRYCSLWPRGWGHLFTGGLSTRGDFDDPRDAAPAWALAASVLPWAFDPEFARVRLAPACVEAR
ncbi:MAG: ATP-grasp domain-containing protein [Planctomycetota bacterium]